MRSTRCGTLRTIDPVKPKKDEEIKARVDGSTKAALWQMALSRHLDLSDLVREALRDFIRKNQQAPANNS